MARADSAGERPTLGRQIHRGGIELGGIVLRGDQAGQKRRQDEGAEHTVSKVEVGDCYGAGGRKLSGSGQLGLESFTGEEQKL